MAIAMMLERYLDRNEFEYDLVKHAGGYTQGTYKLSVEIVRSKVHGDSIDVEEIHKLKLDGSVDRPVV